MKPYPFALPLRVEDNHFLVGADCELIANMKDASIGELDAVIEAVNAYPKLMAIAEAAQNLIDMKGRHNTEVAYKRLEDAVKELK